MGARGTTSQLDSCATARLRWDAGEQIAQQSAYSANLASPRPGCESGAGCPPHLASNIDGRSDVFSEVLAEFRQEKVELSVVLGR